MASDTARQTDTPRVKRSRMPARRSWWPGRSWGVPTHEAQFAPRSPGPAQIAPSPVSR